MAGGGEGDASYALKAPRPGLAGAGPLPESGGEAAVEDADLQRRASGGVAPHRGRSAEAAGAHRRGAGVGRLAVALPESRSAWRATLLAALTLKSRGLTPNLLLPLDIGWRSRSTGAVPARIDSAHRGVPRLGGSGRDRGPERVRQSRAGGGTLALEPPRPASNSRMPALVELLLERPFVSVALAAKALGISRQAAHAMLKRWQPVHKLTDRNAATPGA